MADDREESQVDRAKLRVLVERLQTDMHELKGALLALGTKMDEVKEVWQARFSETWRRIEGHTARLDLHETRIAAVEKVQAADAESKRKWVAMVVNHGFTVATGLLVAYLALKGGCR